MSNSFTKEQNQAIDTIGCNTLVSAAAGSGKTAVLVERILKLIKNGTSVDSMLIVTFTNAAAAEMKERIKKALQAKYVEAVQEKNYDELSYYLGEIRKLQTASISTLHSFCIDVIKKYAYVLDLANMRIGDEAELNEIAEQCCKQLFMKKYEAQDDKFFSALNILANGKDKRLYEIIMELNSFSKSIEDPKEWMLNIIKQYSNTDIENSEYYGQLKDSFISVIKNAISLVERAHSIAEISDEKAEKVLFAELETLKSIISIDSSKLKDNVMSMSYDTLRFTKDVDPDAKEQIKQLRDDGKKIIKNLSKSVFCLPVEELLRRQEVCLPLVSELIKLTIEFDDMFLAAKQSRSIMDFSDLEHYALSILKNEDACANYRKKYTHIFIDEYQDTNAVQEAIISSIKRIDNVFMVGDVKQSVYRFRQADPTLFLKKYEIYGNTIGNEDGLAIDLRANFRSASHIIGAVNAVFEKNMSKEIGEIDYDNRAKLTPGFEIESKATTSIYLIDGKEEDEQLKMFSGAQKEALAIADIINNYLGQTYYDAKSGSEKIIEYGDIAILLRSAKGYIGPLTNALVKLGVPCYEDTSSLQYSGQEVSLILSMLKIIDNIREDVALLGVMHSVIGAFTVDELIEIRSAHDQGLYYDALCDYALKETLLSGKVQLFLNKIEGYSTLKNVIPISQLIERILSDTGYYMYAGALPAGNARQINIDALLYKARTFESNIGGNLYEFIVYMQRTLDKNDSGDAAGITREQKLVRLMTVHKSKGLEFPVVIIAGAGKNVNSSTKNDYCTHRKLGLGMKYIDRDQHIKTGSLSYSAVKDINDKEGMSEELRIMYVALTRAIAHISIVGQVSDVQKKMREWQYTQPVSAKNWLGWIMPAALENNTLFTINTIASSDADQLFKNIITKDAFVQAKNNIIEEGPSKQMQIVSNRLNFVYESKAEINTKTSVSAISKQDSEMTLSLKKPSFIEEIENSGAFKGTATHELLAHIDLSAINEEQIINQIELLLNKRILTEQEAAVIDVGKVEKFMQSGIAERMRNAKELRREQPFTIKKDLGQGDVLIQGIIDCCFIEDDSWVLLDFKTDAVYTEAQIKEKAEYYSQQLNLYKEALTKITGKDVKETYIYFLSAGAIIEQ